MSGRANCTASADLKAATNGFSITAICFLFLVYFWFTFVDARYAVCMRLVGWIFIACTMLVAIALIMSIGILSCGGAADETNHASVMATLAALAWMITTISTERTRAEPAALASHATHAALGRNGEVASV